VQAYRSERNILAFQSFPSEKGKSRSHSFWTITQRPKRVLDQPRQDYTATESPHVKLAAPPGSVGTRRIASWATRGNHITLRHCGPRAVTNAFDLIFRPSRSGKQTKVLALAAATPRAT